MKDRPNLRYISPEKQYVVGESADGTYYVTSTGPGTQYTIFDKTAGLDNFILTPEPATIVLLGLGSLALISRRK